jgi:hypothetical protein
MLDGRLLSMGTSVFLDMLGPSLVDRWCLAGIALLEASAKCCNLDKRIEKEEHLGEGW